MWLEILEKFTEFGNVEIELWEISKKLISILLSSDKISFCLFISQIIVLEEIQNVNEANDSMKEKTNQNQNNKILLLYGIDLI